MLGELLNDMTSWIHITDCAAADQTNVVVQPTLCYVCCRMMCCCRLSVLGELLNEFAPRDELHNILSLVCNMFSVQNALVSLFFDRRVYIIDGTGVFSVSMQALVVAGRGRGWGQDSQLSSTAGRRKLTIGQASAVCLVMVNSTAWHRMGQHVLPACFRCATLIAVQSWPAHHITLA
jgi:hypothetical protein